MRRFVSFSMVLAVLLAAGLTVRAQETTPTADSPAAAQTPDSPAIEKGDSLAEKPDPLKRRLTDHEEYNRRKAARIEIKGEYKKWLNEDVVWIITPEEETAFKQLTNDEERDQFIENFWARRNPNPDSPDNEYRDEHYARIAYANEHFAAGKPGWRTDRGHIYIAYGKPDSIDSHPSGGNYQRPLEEGGGSTSTFPFEVWHYRYLEGVGDNVDIEFVDTCQCGDYHATIDRSEKDALKHVPGAGQTLYEQMGKATQADRMDGGLEQLGKGPMSDQQNSKQFDRLDRFAKLFAPPPIKFADMEQFLGDAKILSGPPFLFDVRTDYVKLTNDTVMVPLTLEIKNKDMTFNTKDGVSIATVNILGRVSNLNHKIVQTFEDPVQVEVPSDLLARTQVQQSVYWKALALRPGLYKVEIAIKDVNQPDHVGVWRRSVNVPKYDDDHLASSSLILADVMEKVPSKDVGSGNFVIGNTKLRPRVPDTVSTPVTFHRGQNLNFWMQVYNLGIGDNKKNNATIDYKILDLTTNKTVVDTQEASDKLNPNADQLTLAKSMSLASLEPGKYKVTIQVNDSETKQEIAQSAAFNVVQ
jgi:GWxTD domain-containing protein